MRRDEQGVALLTVLLLVAVMSALAVSLLDDIRLGLRRAQNARAVGQAQWYALGSESLARAQILRLVRADTSRTPLDGDWNGRTFSFPTDEGGLIEATVRDGGACFNLNSVVEGRGEVLQRRQDGVAQFMALARALDVGPAEATRLADSLSDWIDSDSFRHGRGAEDEAYLEPGPPYRTGGALLAEVSELRAVRGVTPAVYARLRPYVCALPTSALSPLNPNTLPPEKSVLLTAVTDGRLSPEQARRVLANRPAGGWRDLAAFWGEPLMQGAEPSNAALAQVSLTTRFFELQTHVRHLDTEVVMTSLLESDRSALRLVARRWTLDE